MYRLKLPAFLLAAFLLALSSSGHASEDVKQKYSRIQGQIKKQEEKLQSAKTKERSILGQIQDADKALLRVQRELAIQRAKLNATNARIDQTNRDIAETKASLEGHKAWFKRRLRAMNRQGPAEELIMLLGADDMGSFLRRWSYLKILAKKEKDAFESYKAEYEQLQEKEQELAGLQGRLKMEEARTSQDEGSLAAKKAARQKLLASVRSERDAHAQVLKELKQAAQQLLAIIRRSDKSNYKGAGSFHALKGLLMWPVQGTVALRYGRQLDPRFNTPIFRNGIYIRTASDAVARCVWEGKVVYADWFKGYGQLVIINHGGGYNTLYANLAQIFLKVGDIIEKKAPIGKVADSDAVNGPSLYFEVRYKGKPLNPLQWLARH